MLLAGPRGPSKLPAGSSLELVMCMLALLLERLVKELAMLATLSLRITEDAEDRTRCSLRARTVIPGKGRTSRVHTSERRASRRARSPRDGARTGMREFVVSRDCDLLMDDFEADTVASLSTLVFFRMTWHSGDLGPTVVARWIEIRRVTVPVLRQRPWPSTTR